MHTMLDALTGRGHAVRMRGEHHADAQCPAHEDMNPSLSIDYDTHHQKVLFCCQTGCAQDAVLDALGLRWADLHDDTERTPRGGGRQVVATYDYTDEAGTVLYQKVRFAPKDFRQRRPDGAGGWTYKLGDVRRVLYRLPQVLAAVQDGATVYLAEGEKDADRLADAGVVATTWSDGAWQPGKRSKWRAEYTEALRGGHVVIVADRDDSGRATAADIARALDGAAASVAVVEAVTGKDAADHLAAGHTVAEFTPVSAAPVPPVAPHAPVHQNPSQTGAPLGAAPVEPVAQDAPVQQGGTGTGAETGAVLDDVRDWLARYVITMREDDLDLLTLWAAHTHLVEVTYTTPRLVLDSPVPGSGKTTVLEHLQRLCLHPLQAASLSSPSLLTRMLAAGMRTILIDEADRSLSPDKEGVGELLAVLNSGYKRGASRPVLVPAKGGEWEPREMPTYSPVAMAGNNPNLPEDTRSRCVRVLLMPDTRGEAEESDWELIEPEAQVLGQRLATWAGCVRDSVRVERPPLPEGVKGRARERWSPLKRVAAAAGGRWPQVVDELAEHDVAQVEADREDGMVTQRPHVALLGHLFELWPEGEPFWSTSEITAALAYEHPDMWGEGSPFGKPLTAQRFGRMLATAYGINSGRMERTGPRGYSRASMERAWLRMGIAPDAAPVRTPPGETGESGATGETGAPTCPVHGDPLGPSGDCPTCAVEVGRG
ncbi:DUF3631 domain-containing protein [Kytococcus sedentarius]|uniref:DUF3631 domain-containing protein n=1 Tax=Kytococcus sedentarius TaxID=1276 RepID=UPI003850880C